MRRAACDVLVAGGGTAGVMAAIGAARAGAATLLLERDPVLGGIGQAGMLRQICGLYRNGGTTAGELLNPALLGELVERLGTAPQRMGRVWVQPLGPTDFDTLLTSLCRIEAGLTVLRNHAVTAATTSHGRLTQIIAAGADGPLAVTPRAVVDATGDGELAGLAGASVEQPPAEGRQLAGFTVHVGGLQGAADDLPLQVPFACARGVTDGSIPPALRFTTFSRAATPDEGYCKLSIAGRAGRERDRQAGDDARRLVTHLATTLPAFRAARIIALSPRVLDREGGRIGGEYRLTADDILAARKFPDAAVRGAWPMETWESERGTVYRYGPDGDWYDIPFRAMQVRGLVNLLAAGRCLGATREALASTRVIGSCLALGARAGQAAAHYAGHGSYPPELLP